MLGRLVLGFQVKPPELLWSPTKGLLIKDKGWWYRLLYSNGVRPIGAEAIDLPDDTQTVWVADEAWLQKNPAPE